MHLQEALQAFLLQLRADGRSPHTIGQYRRHGWALIGWLEAEGRPSGLADLSPTVVAAFFASETARTSCRGGAKRATSVNAMRTSIRCFGAYLHDAGLVDANPARLLRRARCTPPPPRALGEAEQARVRAVLEEAETPQAQRDVMLFDVLLGTGVRLGSALALDVEDLDLKGGEARLRTSKGDRPCAVVLPKTLVARLQAYLGGRADGPLFLAAGRRLSKRNAQRRLAEWFARAGVKGMSAHALRHAFATGLLARTGDLRLVQAALNHASIASTTIYAAVDRSKLRAVLGADLLENSPT